MTEWTSKTPNQPGAYWLRTGDGQTEIVQLVEAYTGTGFNTVVVPYANTSEVWYLGWDIPTKIENLQGPLLWWGPLVPPAAPGDERSSDPLACCVHGRVGGHACPHCGVKP